jgi:hypothetical protein
MRLRTAFLAATALVAVTAAAPAPARAEPISASIAAASAFASSVISAGSVGAAVAGAGTLGAWAINVGVSLGTALGLSFLSSALGSKPKAGDSLSGIEQSMEFGGDVPRQIPVGRCALKGQMLYVNTFGMENVSMQQVFLVADWPTSGLVAVWLAGNTYTLQQISSGQGWKRYTVPVFGGFVNLTYYDGTQTAADPELVAAAPAGRWDATCKLTGCSYVIATYVYNQYSHLYEGGIPDWTFVIDGARLYDRRLDTTAGGSGPQRWNDVSTWAFSANPAVIRENYLRGFWANGQLLLGMGLPAYDLIAETFVAAANAADELVPKAGGGTEPRYRCGTILTADDGVTHQQHLNVIDSTDAGYTYEIAGLYACQAGVAQSSVRTVTDADLILGAPVTYAAKRSRAELVNGIVGQFLDPSTGWQPQDYTPQISTADQAADGGEELHKPLDLLSVSSKTQAERIALIRRREARAQATATITVGYQHRDLIPGDWLTWTSARFGFTKVFRIAERQVDQATKAPTLSLEETAASIYGWSTGNEGPPILVPTQPTAPSLASTVTNFTASAIIIEGDDGSMLPSLRAAWNPITDPTVDTVVVQYRVAGSDKIVTLTDSTPGDGSLVIPGVVQRTVYEVRATITTTPIRTTTWTGWVPVTTGNSTYIIDADRFLVGRLVNGEFLADQVLEFDAITGFLTIPNLRVTGEMIAPGAIAGSNDFSTSSNILFGSSSTGGATVSGNIAGADTVTMFSEDMILDVEVTAFVSVTGGGGGTAVRAGVNFKLVNDDTGTDVAFLKVTEEMVNNNGTITNGNATIRRRISVQAGVNYRLRFSYVYYSSSAFGQAYLSAGNINYIAVRRTGAAPPELRFNFATSGALPLALTTTRNSPAYAFDTDGNYAAFAANVMRRNDRGLTVEGFARTNSLRNNSMQGASAGTPGSKPNNWAVTGHPSASNGISAQVTFVGTANGIDIVRIRWTGTATATLALRATFEAQTQIVAAAGQKWTGSLFMRLVNGSLSTAGISAVGLRVHEANVAGTTLGSTLFPYVPTAADLHTQRVEGTREMVDGLTARTYPQFSATIASGTIVDFEVELGWPQHELGDKASSPIRTMAGAETREAEAIGMTLPDWATTAVYYFPDGSAETRAAVPGPYQIPANLPKSTISLLRVG